MTTVIDGADITILVDAARVPFVLDIHELDHETSILNPESAALSDVTCDVLHAQWTWGASEWAGPLTLPEAGTCQLVLRDPDRLYDPANDAITPPIPGRLLQILVDGAPAWTGHVADITHSLAAGESVIMGHDAIALLTGQAFPYISSAGTTLGQYQQVLNLVGWPAGERVAYGAPAAWREGGVNPESAWPALIRIGRAELGTVWADRLNRVAFRSRGIDAPPVSILPVIGCDGADVEDVASLLVRRGVMNHVLIEGNELAPVAVEWFDAYSVGIFGRRTLRATRDDLRLGYPP